MTEIITSFQNRFVKEARALCEKKFRDETGLFLVEGVNLLKDMPGDVRVKYAFATPAKYAEAEAIFSARTPSSGNPNDGEFSIESAAGRAKNTDCGFNADSVNKSNDEDTVAHTRARVYYVSEDVMKSVSGTVSPYGIAAVAYKPDVKFALPDSNALLLDGVSDPGNLGTIIRTAAATGFNTVYLLECADVYSPKTVRATLGGLFKVKTVNVDFEEALVLVQETQSAALDMAGEDVTAAKIPSPVLFIAGSEAHGVRGELIEKTKKTYALPMKNNIESLNVAVATAVAMYQTI